MSRGDVEPLARVGEEWLLRTAVPDSVHGRFRGNQRTRSDHYRDAPH